MSDFWEQSEVRAKLSVLRAEAVDALVEFERTGSRTAADFYIVAQAKYTLGCAEVKDVVAQAKYRLGCAEVKDDSILDSVEVE